MLPSLEHIRPGHGASFVCRHNAGSHFPFHWHLHPEIELTHIIAGQGRRFVGNHVQDFSPGEVVLLGSNLPHTWHTQPTRKSRCDAVVIQFHPEVWGPGFFDLPEFKPIARLLSRASTGLRFTGKMRQEAAAAMVAMDRQDPAARLLSLWQLLQRLARSRAFVTLATPGHSVPLRAHDQQRIDIVLRHLSMHYTQPVDQAKVASLLHLSPSAFSRFFRRMTGRTFMDFLHDLRVNHACRLLAQTDLPVTTICFDSGFANLSNFNRRFRQIQKCCPRAFRLQSQSD